MDAIALDHIRIILAGIMLGYACYADIRYRQVRNVVWVIFGGIGLGLIPLAGDMGAELVNVAISALVIPVAFAVYRFGMLGGADALAICALAILAPAATISGGSITPLTVFLNALMLSVFLMACNYVRNYMISRHTDLFAGFDETVPRKRIAMLIGRKVKNPRFAFPMEYDTATGKKLYLKLQHVERAEYASKPDSWVSLGTPWMLLILGGFVIQLFYGDLLFSVFNIVSGN